VHREVHRRRSLRRAEGGSVTTAVLARRARYLQLELANYRLRVEYGITGLDAQIMVTLDLLMLAEDKLCERGLFLRSDGEIVNMPRQRDKRPRVAA
jgi:hypothetical protein